MSCNEGVYPMAIDALNNDVWEKCVEEIEKEITKQRRETFYNTHKDAEEIMHKVYNVLRGFKS